MSRIITPMSRICGDLTNSINTYRGSIMRRIRSVIVVASSALIMAGLVPSGPARAQQMLPCDFQSQGDYSGDYAKVSQKGPFKIREQEIVELESKIDGATIQMGLIRPQVPAGKRVPVIVN